MGYREREEILFFFPVGVLYIENGNHRYTESADYHPWTII